MFSYIEKRNQNEYHIYLLPVCIYVHYIYYMTYDSKKVFKISGTSCELLIFMRGKTRGFEKFTNVFT